jgi:hypothetical protein
MVCCGNAGRTLSPGCIETDDAAHSALLTGNVKYSTPSPLFWITLSSIHLAFSHSKIHLKVDTHLHLCMPRGRIEKDLPTKIPYAIFYTRTYLHTQFIVRS